MTQTGTAHQLTVGSIAYTVDKKSGYTVCIIENDKYVPYLVLTDNYNSNALLLRLELLDEANIYNEYSAYYNCSVVDRFLNEEFLETLEPGLRAVIADTEIAITTESSLGTSGQDTEQIVRKAFLLSYTELDFSGAATVSVEGKPLKFFADDPSRRIALRNGEPSSWWLRSPTTWHASTAFGIADNGSGGGGGVYNLNGSRPAFCLPCDTPLIEVSENGRNFFAVKLDAD